MKTENVQIAVAEIKFINDLIKSRDPDDVNRLASSLFDQKDVCSNPLRDTKS
jgi:hypothetical protein